MRNLPKDQKHQLVVISAGLHTKAILKALNNMPEIVNTITTEDFPDELDAKVSVNIKATHFTILGKEDNLEKVFKHIDKREEDCSSI